MPQIYDMGPLALLPLRRKERWGFFRPEKSWRLRLGLKPRIWVLKGSTLPQDHRSRLASILHLVSCAVTVFSPRSCKLVWYVLNKPECHCQWFEKLVNQLIAVITLFICDTWCLRVVAYVSKLNHCLSCLLAIVIRHSIWVSFWQWHVIPFLLTGELQVCSIKRKQPRISNNSHSFLGSDKCQLISPVKEKCYS